MTLDREAVLTGIPVELESFSTLVRSLTADDLTKATRCVGWSVGHVVSHVIGTIVDLTQGRLEGQGTPAVTERQALERPGRTPQALARELDEALPSLRALLASLPEIAWQRPSPADPSYSLGFAVEAIWFDTYVHADDIRAALPAPAQRGAGLLCAVHHIAGYLERRGDAMTLHLDGMAPISIGNGGTAVTGDPYRFVLAATGRIDASSLGLPASINVYRDQGAERS
jgi:uncharacterized protein (TIGR03083 family)